MKTLYIIVLYYLTHCHVSFECKRISGSSFLAVNHIGVYLCRSNVFVRQHLRYRIDVISFLYKQRCVCVSECMKTDLLCDASLLHPSFKVAAGHGLCKPGEDNA